MFTLTSEIVPSPAFAVAITVILPEVRDLAAYKTVITEPPVRGTLRCVVYSTFILSPYNVTDARM